MIKIMNPSFLLYLSFSILLVQGPHGSIGKLSELCNKTISSRAKFFIGQKERFENCMKVSKT